MPRRWQTSEKAPPLAFAEVLVRGRIPRICFLNLQLQGRPRLDDLSRQLRRQVRARGGISQEPRAPEQPRVTGFDCIQLVLGDSLWVLGDYLIRRPAIRCHPGQAIGIVRWKELRLFGPALHRWILLFDGIEKRLDRHVGVDQRAAANAARRYDVCLTESVVAVQRPGPLFASEKLSDSAAKVLQRARYAIRLYHRQKVYESAAVIRPRPVLHRLRLQEWVHRILGRQFRREPPHAPFEDKNSFPFSRLVDGGNCRSKSRADHNYIEIKGHDSSSDLHTVRWRQISGTIRATTLTSELTALSTASTV